MENKHVGQRRVKSSTESACIFIHVILVQFVFDNKRYTPINSDLLSSLIFYFTVLRYTDKKLYNSF